MLLAIYLVEGWFLLAILSVSFLLRMFLLALVRRIRRKGPLKSGTDVNEALYLTVSRLSHQLKNTGEVIRGHLHGFTDQLPQDEERWRVARRVIGDEALEVGNLTQHLDLMVRLGMSGQPLVMEPVNIPLLLEDLMINLAPAAEAKGIVLGASPCSVTMNENRGVNANFKLIPPPPLPVLTTSAGTGGTVSPSGSNTYALGSVVVVTQAANSGYTFTSWSGHCSGSGACSVTMNAGRKVTASFGLIPDVEHDLTTAASPIAGGAVSPSGTNSYADGTSVTVTATANSGYEFSSWSGGCFGSGSCSVTMNADRNVTANFTLNPLAGKIVFRSTATTSSALEIYVIDPDGSNQVRLTNNTFTDANPIWSTDGSKVGFNSIRGGNEDVWVMNADGSNQVNLTNNASFDSSAAWSPDGSKIAFISARDGVRGIFVMNTDGSNVVQLIGDMAEAANTAWSPDGSKIAFSAKLSGDHAIYTINADGTNLTNLTNGSNHDTEFDWSPDGSKIAFQSVRDGNWEIYVMNADGSNQTRLTSNSIRDQGPSWSPDGSKMVFYSERNAINTFELYVMDADGSNATRITNNASFGAVSADWGP